LFELKLGGVVYVLGVVFFKCDGRIPLAHAIWHLFVVAGSMIHYLAVMDYLYGGEALARGGGGLLADPELTAPKLIRSEF
jgi:monocyte-to-macrophage differentiation protein